MRRAVLWAPAPGDHVITDRDHGADALVKRLRSMARPTTLTVGVHEDAPAADHAAAVEFGTATRPPESFLRAWADARSDEHRAALRQAALDAAQGTRSIEDGLAALGARFVPEVQALAPAGTGELRESIAAEVRS